MKIFILEDNPDRMIAFKSTLKDHTIIHAVDVKEAKEKFDKNKPFDSILLDHDLGGEIYVDSDFWNTGYQFVRFLTTYRSEDIKNTQIIIHTQNPVGAENMLQLFIQENIQAKVIPFPILINQIKIME